jgi:hypothetical protein
MLMSTATSSVACAAAGRRLICCEPRMPCPQGTPDPAVLAWAAAENRILITNDRNTMVGFAYQRVAAEDPVPGLIVTTNHQSIGEAIDDILLIAECMSEEEIKEQVVVFLPFRG